MVAHQSCTLKVWVQIPACPLRKEWEYDQNSKTNHSGFLSWSGSLSPQPVFGWRSNWQGKESYDWERNHIKKNMEETKASRHTQFAGNARRLSSHGLLLILFALTVRSGVRNSSWCNGSTIGCKKEREGYWLPMKVAEGYGQLSLKWQLPIRDGSSPSEETNLMRNYLSWVKLNFG